MTKPVIGYICGGTSYAPDGMVWCYWEDKENRQIRPHLMPADEAVNPIPCQDCGEPCVTLSGFWPYLDPTSDYCAICARVHLDYEWRPQEIARIHIHPKRHRDG